MHHEKKSAIFDDGRFEADNVQHAIPVQAATIS